MPKRPKTKAEGLAAKEPKATVEARYQLRPRAGGKVVAPAKAVKPPQASIEAFTQADRAAASALVAMRNQLHRSAPGAGVSVDTAVREYKVLVLRGG